MIVPSNNTALAKPAEACSRNGPTEFFQAKSKDWKRLRRLRARSWLTATRIRNSRSGGDGTGPKTDNDDCTWRSESHSWAH